VGATLGDLAEGLGLVRLSGAEGWGSLAPRGVTMDSRRVAEGWVFVAAPGATAASRDGHEFVEKAAAQGASVIIVGRDVEVEGPVVLRADAPRAAAAVLAERFCGSPSKALEVVGVTGTNGKTTVSALAAQLLEGAGRRAAIFGTLGVGAPLAPRATGFTTPEAEVLSAELKGLVDQRFDCVCLEVSSHALALDRVAGVEVDVACFTNLSPEHLDLHGDMDAYFEAKLRLFTERLADSGIAVLPSRADRWCEALRERCPDAVTYGREASADVRASAVRLDARGAVLTVEVGGGSAAVRAPLIGEHNVDNLLAALACGRALGADMNAMLSAVPHLRSVPGRMEVVAVDDGPVVVVDYAHTPDALARALEALRPLSKGKLRVVFGCGGDRDAKKRPLMGEVAMKGADEVFVTDDNPRSEVPGDIRAAILAAAEGAWEIGDRRAAIEAAVTKSTADDVVLVAGKGHEKVQIVGDERHPFDDVEVARAALRGRA
jgi:UDP-N-acetylmuramoyl-L-alanyl-D-glutamate--2,6-diaminopimelate ligase